MARGKKTGGRNIKPGQVLNPLGAGAQDPVLRAIKRMTKEEVADVGALLLQNNLDALITVRKDPQSSVLKVWFAAVAIKAIERGDPVALNILLNRIIGRVPEELRHTGEGGGPMRFQDMNQDQARAAALVILERVRNRGR